MIKLMFCLRRRPDMTRREFLDYWSGHHASIAQRGATAMRVVRYVQNHTLTHPVNDVLLVSRDAPEPFDGVVEVWYASMNDLEESFREEDAVAAARELIGDEPQFIDLESSPIFVVEEHELVGGGVR